jgi:hypothetical protein
MFEGGSSHYSFKRLVVPGAFKFQPGFDRFNLHHPTTNIEFKDGALRDPKVAAPVVVRVVMVVAPVTPRVVDRVALLRVVAPVTPNVQGLTLVHCSA